MANGGGHLRSYQYLSSQDEVQSYTQTERKQWKKSQKSMMQGPKLLSMKPLVCYHPSAQCSKK